MLVMQKVVFAAVIGFGAHAAVGGWPVISVENPPEYLEAGTSYKLEYTVRQHGVELLPGLQGRVVVHPRGTGPGGEVAAASQSAGSRGRYSATFRVPDADRVTITVKSGFGGDGWGDLTLIEVPVVRAGQARPAITGAGWGRHLFVAKGCGTCHLNGDVPEWAQLNRQSGRIGPELTGRRLEAAYVRQRLTDPSSLPKIGTGNIRMPNLNLAAAEVDALVALLSGATARAGL